MAGTIRFFLPFLLDFLLSVAAMTLEDAKLDSQVHWKQSIHSIKFNRAIRVALPYWRLSRLIAKRNAFRKP